MNDGALTHARSLVDLHTHSRHKSMDSGLAPDILAQRAKAVGLSAVCVTEHNNIWLPGEAAALSEAFAIPVLRGMEISTDAGHVLVFGVEGYALEMFNVERLRALVEYEGGAMVLAHPTRGQGFRRPWHQAPQLFEALECLNGDDHNRSAEYVFDLARDLGMAATGGSDAHTAQAVGRRATLFECRISSERHLIDALHGGRFRPVDPTSAIESAGSA